MRIFVGTFPPESIASLLAEVIDPYLNTMNQIVRPTPAANRHLTWAFIGDVDEKVVDETIAAVREWKSPERTAGGAVVALHPPEPFPDARRPRVIVLPLGGQLAPLVRMRERLVAAMATSGVPFDPKPFRPHMTVGYVRKKHRGPVSFPDQGGTFPAAAWNIDGVDVIESRLEPGGARYTSLYHRDL